VEHIRRESRYYGAGNVAFVAWAQRYRVRLHIIAGGIGVEGRRTPLSFGEWDAVHLTLALLDQKPDVRPPNGGRQILMNGRNDCGGQNSGNKLLSNREFRLELSLLLNRNDKESRMALKALAQRRAKPAVVKTLPELLAQVFSASSLYNGEKFFPEFFSFDENCIYYREKPEYDDYDNPIFKGYDGDLDFRQPFSGSVSTYCCGLLEIGNFKNENFTKDPAINSALMRVFMAGIKTGYHMVFGTVTPGQKIARAYLEEAGFVPVAEYKSRTTKATITVMMNDLSAKKELPPSGLDIDLWDYNY